ncbi:BTB/Kelch-associated [Trinorchestia longiramus]|nr:BTB/Kelch-associated [Trinorchestia longiramus]
MDVDRARDDSPSHEPQNARRNSPEHAHNHAYGELANAVGAAAAGAAAALPNVAMAIDDPEFIDPFPDGDDDEDDLDYQEEQALFQEMADSDRHAPVAVLHNRVGPVLSLSNSNSQGRLLLRHASQNSLDESSQRNLPRNDGAHLNPPYTNGQHFQRAFDVFNVMRSGNTLCDVVLVAGDVEVTAHKMVLAACSPYFHAMFTSKLYFHAMFTSKLYFHAMFTSKLYFHAMFTSKLYFHAMFTSKLYFHAMFTSKLYFHAMFTSKLYFHAMFTSKLYFHAMFTSKLYFHAMFTSFEESRQERIVLREIDGAALELIIDYVYTADISVTEENVQVLLPAANILQLTYVRDSCCEFLQSQLHPTNCLGIRAFADLHGCLELLNIADAYVETHFTEVVECEEFLSLTHDQVVRLISSDKLQTPAEEKVFECVMAWVQHDVSSRQQHMADLVACVRLPLLQQDYLVQRVEQEPLLKGNIKCKDFLIEALKYHLLSNEQRLNFKTPRTKPRQPVGVPKVLLVVGGQSPKAVRSVECYDFKTEKWSAVAEMPTRRCRCGLAVVDGRVYAVGGFNGSLRVRTVDVYDPASNTWTGCANMEARRSTLGVATIDGKIYAVGGFDGSTGLNSAEVYDPRKAEWRMIAPMTTRRSSVGVGVVLGKLYAVGGYDGASRQCLSGVERYCPETDVWTPVAQMTARRSGAGIGVIDGELYAVGGHDGPLVRNSVEVYNPSTNKWRVVAEMNLCRRNAGVIAVDGMLYVVGGDDGNSNLTSVEIYDPVTGTWTVLPASLSIGRSYAGLAVVEKPGLHSSI